MTKQTNKQMNKSMSIVNSLPVKEHGLFLPIGFISNHSLKSKPLTLVTFFVVSCRISRAHLYSQPNTLWTICIYIYIFILFCIPDMHAWQREQEHSVTRVDARLCGSWQEIVVTGKKTVYSWTRDECVVKGNSNMRQVQKAFVQCLTRQLY